MTTPKNVHQLLQSVLQMQDVKYREKEQFWVLMLDMLHHLKSFEVIAIGAVNKSLLVHPRGVFRRSMSVGCSTIILAHSHPTGSSKPSSEDIEITKQLVEAGKIIGIEVLDHIITTGESYYSFKEEMKL